MSKYFLRGQGYKRRNFSICVVNSINFDLFNQRLNPDVKQTVLRRKRQKPTLIKALQSSMMSSR